jgi:drug/metabolite transporter (DMT)-like permease
VPQRGAQRAADDARQRLGTRTYLTGIACGVAMAVLGGIYTVYARYGVLHGFTPFDLTAIRYGTAALVLAPVFARVGWSDLGGVGWGRATLLAAGAGPTFTLLLFGGLQLAPLAHGGVITPATITLFGMVFSVWMFNDRLDRNRWIGIVLVIMGLAALGGDGLINSTGWQTLLGDVMFVCAGIAWALFGTLLRRWRTNPLRASAAIALMSALAYLPFYFAFADLGGWQRVSAGHMVLQLILQGLFAGAVNLLLFTKMIEILGASRGAMFASMVPAMAVLTGIPVLGEIPNALQWTGLIVISLGLALSLIRPSIRGNG